MSFFRNLDRKQKRQFNKLNKKDQQETVAAALQEKYSNVLQREVSKAFVRGVMFGNNTLYDKFVTKWDAAKYDDKRKVAKELVEEIRQHHDKYVQMFESESKEETSQEEK